LSMFPDPEVTEETSLIQAGLIDSTAILQLAEWIEGETGVDLEMLQFDLSNEWDTIIGIERFIQRHRRNQVS
jgi:acyl carrier protein